MAAQGPGPDRIGDKPEERHRPLITTTSTQCHGEGPLDLAQWTGLVGDFGPLGLMIVYLVWRENKAAEAQTQREKDAREVMRERIEADKALAASLGALTAVVQRLDR